MSDKITNTIKMCEIAGCGKKHLAKNLCQTHYDRDRSKNKSRRYSQLLRKSRIKNIECLITESELDSIVSKGCYYCGSQRLSYGHGLDRLDSTKGYTVDNVVGCCGYCNKLKMEQLTPNETLEIVKKLKELRNRQNIWE